MAPHRFLFGVSAALLLLGKAHASGSAPSDQSVPYEHKVGKTGACLSTLNAAREHAGLTPFAQATATAPDGELPLDSAAQLWGIACEPLLSESEKQKVTNELFYKSAYASFELPTASPNCTEAVDYWNAAFPNFVQYELPPANDMSTQLYSSRENISFVALYNPSQNAAADCRVFTCTKLTSASPVSGDGEPSPDKTEESAHSLICLTTPDILEFQGPAPFTKEEWEKIKGSFSLKGTSAGTLNFGVLFPATAILLGLAAFW